MLESLKKFFSRFRRGYLLHVAYDSGGKQKQTVVLLHGIAATSKTWDLLVREFKADNYRIITLDLLGFGESPKPAVCEYNVEDHVASVRRTLRKLKVHKPFKLVGHSMGSIIAARYCRMYPRDIKRAYLLSPPLYPKDAQLHTNISRSRTDLYLNAYDYLSKNKDFTIKNSQILRNLLRVEDGMEVNENNWNSFRLSLRNTIVKQNAYDDIKNATMPINIIYGTLDEFLIQKIVDKLALTGHVKVTKLPIVNHLIGHRFAKEAYEQISKHD